MNPIRSIFLPAAVAVLILYGASGAMAASAAPAAAGQLGGAAAQAEVDTGVQLVRGHHGGSGGMRHGGGGAMHRGPSGGFSPPAFSGKGGFSGPKSFSPKHFGSSRPSFRPYTPPQSYGFVRGGKHHKRHFRHHRRGFYFYPYYSYYPYDYYDYSYSSSYSSCYWNCRRYHGPRYCRIHWRRYCY